MIAFLTASGSTYTIENGRITRGLGAPIEDVNGGPAIHTMRALSYNADAPPTVGRRFRFTPKGWTQPITTSPIEQIAYGDAARQIAG